MSTTWADMLNPRALYGAPAPGVGAPPATTTAKPLSSSAGSTAVDTPPPWSPDNPLFWFALIAAATVGLIGANANLRVGRFKAGASAGKAD